jgi:hypothetical protein
MKSQPPHSARLEIRWPFGSIGLPIDPRGIKSVIPHIRELMVALAVITIAEIALVGVVALHLQSPVKLPYLIVLILAGALLRRKIPLQ